MRSRGKTHPVETPPPINNIQQQFAVSLGGFDGFLDGFGLNLWIAIYMKMKMVWWESYQWRCQLWTIFSNNLGWVRSCIPGLIRKDNFMIWLWFSRFLCASLIKFDVPTFSCCSRHHLFVFQNQKKKLNTLSPGGLHGQDSFKLDGILNRP